MGFSISKEFPGRFIKGDDVAERGEVTVSIKAVKKEQVFSRTTNKKEEVLALYFEGTDKAVILKKERSTDLVKITGSDDTDGWIGKDVCLYTEKKSCFGGTHNVIRFKKAE